MRAPILKEKILRELAVKGETSVKELLAKFKVNRPYLYRILRSLESNCAIILETGKIKVVDKKALLYTWGEEKRKIFQVIKGITYRVRPKKVRDFVVFSGTSALWVLGKVLEPSFGTAYIKREDFDRLKQIGIKREGYPIRFYSYDEDIFNQCGREVPFREGGDESPQIIYIYLRRYTSLSGTPLGQRSP